LDIQRLSTDPSVLAYSDSELTSEITNTFRYLGTIPWTRDQPIPRQTRIYIHTSSGIRTRNFSVRVVRDHSRLRPHGHWGRHLKWWWWWCDNSNSGNIWQLYCRRHHCACESPGTWIGFAS